MASNILQHVKYKHPNLSIKASTSSNTDSKQKKVLLVKDKTVQIVRDCVEVVQQRPEIRRSEEKAGNGEKSLPGYEFSKPTRTTKGANPNKDIIKRASKGGQHKLNSLAGLADLFKFEDESVSCDPKTE